MENNKPFDLIVEECRQKIYDVLNSSTLPMSVINMIVSELQQTVSTQYAEHLKNLRESVELKKEKEKDVQ